MEIHPVDIIISIINIIVLFSLLRLFLWKHVIRYLNERSARIKADMDDAQKAREDAESIQAQCNQKLATLQQRGDEIIAESRQIADEESEKILAEAKEKADNMLREAEKRIEAEKKQAIIDSHNEIAQLAADMATRVLEREVSGSDNSRAVNDFFKSHGDK